MKSGELFFFHIINAFLTLICNQTDAVKFGKKRGQFRIEFL